MKKPPVAARIIDSHGLVTAARVGTDGPYLQVTRVKRSGSQQQVKTVTPEGRVKLRAWVPIGIATADAIVTHCHRGNHDVEVPVATLRGAISRFQAGGPAEKLKV